MEFSSHFWFLPFNFLTAFERWIGTFYYIGLSRNNQTKKNWCRQFCSHFISIFSFLWKTTISYDGYAYQLMNIVFFPTLKIRLI